MSEPYFEPLAIPRMRGEPEPVCPECGGLLARAIGPEGEIWHCQIHRWVDPEWAEPLAEEEE